MTTEPPKASPLLELANYRYESGTEREPLAPQRPNTVAGLIEKHRAIAGRIETTRRTLDALVFDLQAVEHTIRLFDPDAQLGRAKPLPSPHAAFKGEMRRDVLAALRAAQAPLTSLDIAQQIMAARKLDVGMTQAIRKRVGACLWKLRAKGLVAEVPLAGDYKGWTSPRATQAAFNST